MKNNKDFWKTIVVFYRQHAASIVTWVVLVAIVSLLIFSGMIKIPSFNKQSELEKLRSQEQKIADIIRSGDVSQCEKIKGTVINNTDYYNVCKNNILLNQSQSALDISQCDQIDPAIAPPDLCKRNIITKSIANGSDIAMCDSLEPGLARYCKNSYWIKTAIKYDDSAQCNNLKDIQDIVACKDNLAMERLVFESMNEPCESFSSAYRKGCGELKQIRSKLPSGIQIDCSAVTDAVFSGLCEDRRYINNI